MSNTFVQLLKFYQYFRKQKNENLSRYQTAGTIIALLCAGVAQLLLAYVIHVTKNTVAIVNQSHKTDIAPLWDWMMQGCVALGIFTLLIAVFQIYIAHLKSRNTAAKNGPRNIISVLVLGALLTGLGLFSPTPVHAQELAPICETPRLPTDPVCWAKVTNQDCHIWDIAAWAGVEITWSGQCKNQRAHGRGIEIRIINDWSTKGIGSMVNGKRHGWWQWFWSSGASTNHETGERTFTYDIDSCRKYEHGTRIKKLDGGC